METTNWGLRCETARGARWLAIGPLSEREARERAAQHAPNPVGVVKAAQMPPHIVAELRRPEMKLAA